MACSDLRFGFDGATRVYAGVVQIMAGHDGHGVPNEVGRCARFLKSIRLGLNHVPTGHAKDLFNELSSATPRGSIIQLRVEYRL